MRQNTLVSVFFVLHLFFGTEIQARNPTLPDKLPYKSDQVFYEKYCGFLLELNLVLRACHSAETWRANYNEVKKIQEMKKSALAIIRIY